MSLEDIEASLKAPSAKIWPRENDDDGNDLLLDDKLFVPRWADNDRHGDWRLGVSRSSGQLDIKGALLQADRTEQVPPDKTGRADQFTRFHLECCAVTDISNIRRNALRSLIPPPRLQLSEWIESNIRLPEGVSALPRHFLTLRHRLGIRHSPHGAGPDGTVSCSARSMTRPARRGQQTWTAFVLRWAT